MGAVRSALGVRGLIGSRSSLIDPRIGRRPASFRKSPFPGSRSGIAGCVANRYSRRGSGTDKLPFPTKPNCLGQPTRSAHFAGPNVAMDAGAQKRPPI